MYNDGGVVRIGYFLRGGIYYSFFCWEALRRGLKVKWGNWDSKNGQSEVVGIEKWYTGGGKLFLKNKYHKLALQKSSQNNQKGTVE
jgi:hypothetical protein